MLPRTLKTSLEGGKVKMLRILVVTGLILFTQGNVTPQEKNRAESKSQPTMKNEKRDDAPFMCRLDALDTAQRARYQDVRKLLHTGVQEVKELPDGYAFRLSADSSTILLAAEWITFERRCCPFFNFALDIESEKQSLWLSVTGREGVKTFMKLELGVK
jgi:hypothetical protein